MIPEKARTYDVATRNDPQRKVFVGKQGVLGKRGCSLHDRADVIHSLGHRDGFVLGTSHPVAEGEVVGTGRLFPIQGECRKGPGSAGARVIGGAIRAQTRREIHVIGFCGKRGLDVFGIDYPDAGIEPRDMARDP